MSELLLSMSIMSCSPRFIEFVVCRLLLVGSCSRDDMNSSEFNNWCGTREHGARLMVLPSKVLRLRVKGLNPSQIDMDAAVHKQIMVQEHRNAAFRQGRRLLLPIAQPQSTACRARSALNSVGGGGGGDRAASPKAPSRSPVRSAKPSAALLRRARRSLADSACSTSKRATHPA